VHPIHTYASPGLYYACLTVSNEYSADTSCQWIEIESVSTDDTQKKEVFIVHPNPFSDYIEITPADGGFHYRTLHVIIIDIHGRVIASPEMTCPCRLKLGSIPDGVYFYTIKEGGRSVGSGKIVKSGQR
jgi:PKD repeat protein